MSEARRGDGRDAHFDLTLSCVHCIAASGIRSRLRSPASGARSGPPMGTLTTDRGGRSFQKSRPFDSSIHRHFRSSIRTCSIRRPSWSKFERRAGSGEQGWPVPWPVRCEAGWPWLANPRCAGARWWTAMTGRSMERQFLWISSRWRRPREDVPVLAQPRGELGKADLGQGSPGAAL